MEGVDGTMQLPEDDSQAFSALVVWMYRDQLPLFPTEQYKDDGNGCDMYVESLLPLFHLAEKLCINALANQIMDRVQDVHFLHSRMFGGSELETVYAYSHGGSKIRTYGVLMVIQRSSAGEVFDEGHANEGEESDEELLGGFLSCKNPSQTSVETSLRYRWNMEPAFGED